MCPPTNFMVFVAKVHKAYYVLRYRNLVELFDETYNYSRSEYSNSMLCHLAQMRYLLCLRLIKQM